jgi:hypothetical protein
MLSTLMSGFVVFRPNVIVFSLDEGLEVSFGEFESKLLNVELFLITGRTDVGSAEDLSVAESLKTSLGSEFFLSTFVFAGLETDCDLFKIGDGAAETTGCAVLSEIEFVELLVLSLKMDACLRSWGIFDLIVPVGDGLAVSGLSKLTSETLLSIYTVSPVFSVPPSFLSRLFGAL